MADSSINVTPGVGGPNIDLQTLDNGNSRQSVCIGDATHNGTIAPVDGVKGLTTQAFQIPADQCQSATAATGAGVTVTLPAVAGQFHYIVLIEITKYFTVANAASATPLVVTTTNLPGSLAWSFGQPAGAIGVTDERIYQPAAPVKSSVANTATTIVCPATTGIIWRVNVHYYANT